jgi:hypothetical protein
MAASTLEHNSSFKFQHSSPLDALVRRTSSRRAQGPHKPLGQLPVPSPSLNQFRQDPYPPLPPYASHGLSPPRQHQQESPNSPLLHTQFRGSTFSAATSVHNSFLDVSLASSTGGDWAHNVEYVYRDDDASVYSTPSMPPPPHPQDQWNPTDLQLDHEQPSETLENGYTGIASDSGHLPKETQSWTGMEDELAVQADALPTVVVSSMVEPDASSPALEPTRGGKVPIAVTHQFNFSRPGRPPILPPADMKQHVIEPNVGRHPPYPPLSTTPVAPDPVADLPRDMICGSPPPRWANGMVNQPPPNPTQHSVPYSPLGDELADINPYGVPPSVIPVSYNLYSERRPQHRGSNPTSETYSPEPPRNSTPSFAFMSNEPPSPSLILADDLPNSGILRNLTPGGPSQMLNFRANLLSPHSEGCDDAHEPRLLPWSMEASSPLPSLLPTASTLATPGSTGYPVASPKSSPSGLLQNMDFIDNSLLSDPSPPPEQRQLSHWSVDGASILGAPSRIVDRDTASPSPPGSMKSGKKRNKLRKLRKDGSGYESDGKISDWGKKRKGKQKTKEIVVLWPEPQREKTYPQGSPERSREGPSRDTKPIRSAPPAIVRPTLQDFSPVDGHGWRSRSFNAPDPPSSASSPQEYQHPSGSILPDDSPGLDFSQSVNFKNQYPTRSGPLLSSPTRTTTSLHPLHSISLETPPSEGSPQNTNSYDPSPSVKSINVARQQFQRAAPISVNDPQSADLPRSLHPYIPRRTLTQCPKLGNPYVAPQSSGVILPNNLPSAGPALSRNYVQGPLVPLLTLSVSTSGAQTPQVPTSDSPSANLSWNTNVSPTRNPNSAVDGSSLPDYSDYSPTSQEESPGPSTDTVTGVRRPTIELPRAPPPRVVSPAASIYSQYSFYQLDSNNASPTGSSTRGSPDPYNFTPWPQEHRPPFLSPHYSPPPRSPAAGSRSSSPGSNISPTGKLSPHSPQEYLQLGIQHHEANRLEDAAICFEKSAKDDGGCGVGMVMWGLTLRHGWGCEKNENLGFKWLQRAAESAVTDSEHSRKGLGANAVQVGHNQTSKTEIMTAIV